MEESHLTAALSLAPQHCDKGSVGLGVVPTTPVALPVSSQARLPNMVVPVTSQAPHLVTPTT